MKNALAVVAGLLAAFVVFTVIEGLSSIIHPPPAELDMKNPEMMKEYISALPLSAKIMVLAAYVIGSLVAGMVVAKVSKSSDKKLPIITGSILTVAAIVNLYMIPSPIWFVVINLLIYIPFVLLGHSRVIRRQENN